MAAVNTDDPVLQALTHLRDALSQIACVTFSHTPSGDKVQHDRLGFASTSITSATRIIDQLHKKVKYVAYTQELPDTVEGWRDLANKLVYAIQKATREELIRLDVKIVSFSQDKDGNPIPEYKHLRMIASDRKLGFGVVNFIPFPEAMAII